MAFICCPRCHCGRAQIDTSEGELQISCPDCQKTFVAKIVELC
jgi:hypothetical protein